MLINAAGVKGWGNVWFVGWFVIIVVVEDDNRRYVGVSRQAVEVLLLGLWPFRHPDMP
jgi:hypothetical protein